MSKIGRVPIKIPKEVSVTTDGSSVLVKGPKATLSLAIDQPAGVKIEGDVLTVERQTESQRARAMQGTLHRLIQNMIQGVTTGFERRLIIEGIGFKAAVQGRELTLEVGFTNPVKLAIPVDLEVKVEKAVIVVRGADKQQVGQFAASIRKQRPPDAYKGKGIRYEEAVLKLKPGKKAAVVAA